MITLVQGADLILRLPTPGDLAADIQTCLRSVYAGQQINFTTVDWSVAPDLSTMRVPGSVTMTMAPGLWTIDLMWESTNDGLTRAVSERYQIQVRSYCA